MQHQITATIVTYNNDPEQVKKAIRCFLNTSLDVKIYIIDNSPNDKLKELSSESTKVEYRFVNSNLGFGRGHNIILQQNEKLGKYHIILNPDIYFDSGQLEKIFLYMDENQDVGLLMPKILYPDGSMQYLCKILPTPYDWFFRRFLTFLPFLKKRNEIFELRFTGYNNIMNIPYLSGCFMFLRSELLPETGYFDDKIFMYCEDTDLSRRIHKKYKTIFYPESQVYHEFHKESHINTKLLFSHVQSTIYYFNKWGWFFDSDRKKINKTLLNELQNKL